MGVNMGNISLETSPDNPTGHFEDLDFVQFGTKFLVLRGGAWDMPPKINTMMEMLPAERKEFKKLLDSKKKGKELWGWKDPRTVLYISHVWELIPNPTFIWMERNEASCNKSIQARQKRRDGKPIKSSLYAIHKYMLEYFIETSGQLVTSLTYEDLISDPEKYIYAIGKKLNLPVTKEALGFINRDFCHWRE